MHRARNTGTRGPRWAASALLGVTILLSACSSSASPSSAKTTTSTTLPPLPPNLVAYVALAGTGANIGNGSRLVEVTVAPTQSLSGPIPVGLYPDAVAVAPGGRLLLVANYSSNSVTPVVLPGNRVLRPVAAGPGPAAIAIAPGGATAYVTDADSDTVTPIDLRTLKAERPIRVGNGPQGIAITPDGSRAYVADAGAIVSGQTGPIGNEVTPIDLSTRRALAPIRVGNAPVGVAVTPDGSTVFVTNLNSESVTPVSVATDTPGASIATAGGPIAVAVGDRAAWVVNTPAGGQLGNNVQPISLATQVAGRPIRLPRGAQNLAIAPDGTTAWVVCLNSDRLVPVNLVTHRAGRGIVVLGGPFAVAVADQAQGPPPTSTTVAKSKPKKKVSNTTTTTTS